MPHSRGVQQAAEPPCQGPPEAPHPPWHGRSVADQFLPPFGAPCRAQQGHTGQRAQQGQHGDEDQQRWQGTAQGCQIAPPPDLHEMDGGDAVGGRLVRPGVR